jgi:hypothetical protein
MRTTTLVALPLLLLLSLCLGSEATRRSRPYAEYVAKSDAIVIGTVVDTEDFDPAERRRVSIMLVSSVVYGDVHAAAGRWLCVAWCSPWVENADGSVTFDSDQGPDLAKTTGQPMIWLLEHHDDSPAYPVCAGKHIGSDYLEDLERTLEGLAEYRGSGSELAKVRALALHLDVYLRGLADCHEGVETEGRSN